MAMSGKGRVIVTSPSSTPNLAPCAPGWSPLPNVVSHLEVSNDLAFLAEDLGAANGMRVWESGHWRQVHADADYGDSVYGGAFCAQSTL